MAWSGGTCEVYHNYGMCVRFKHAASNLTHLAVCHIHDDGGDDQENGSYHLRYSIVPRVKALAVDHRKEN